jgi:hypothetical protein
MSLLKPSGALRRPFLIIAVILFGLVLILEIGAAIGLDPGRDVGRGAKALGAPGVNEVLQRAGVDPNDIDPAQVQATADANPEPPGLAIPNQALIDGVVLFSLILMALPLLLPERVTGRAQGIASLIVAIIVVIVGIILAIVAIAKLVLMLSLFLAPPFGTVAYLATFGFFPKGQALAVLSISMALKLAACVMLVLAHQRFVQNKGLVLLLLTSLATNVLITFLHGIVPSILVSITDAIAAIIVCVIAVIWAVVMLVFSLVSVVRVLRIARSQA